MTDWLSQLSSIWIFLLILLVLVIALVVIILSSVVRRSEEGETSAQARGAAPPTVVPKEGVPEPTGPTESAAGSFSRAMRFLRSTVSGRDYRYQIPWYLVIGDPNSGKSSLMRGVGANISGSGGSARSLLEWRFLDQGILIAVAGRYFLGGPSRGAKQLERLT
jgi:type VI secretion system protein ImpL